MSPFSLNIDQFGDFPLESPTDHHINEHATIVSDPDTLQQDT